MRRFNDLPIRKKLLTVIWVINLFAVVLVLGTAVPYIISWHRHQEIRRLIAVSHMIEQSCAAALAFNDAADAEEILATLQGDPSITSAWIMTRSGAILARYALKGPPLPAVPPQAPQEGCRFESGNLFCSFPLVLEGNPVGRLALRSDLRTAREDLMKHIGVVAGILLISSLCAVLLSTKLQRVITDPVTKLADLARVISKTKDYSVRAVKQGKDEQAVLIDAFNDMLEQIQQQNAALTLAYREAENAAEKALRLADEIKEKNLILEKEILARRRAEETLQVHQQSLEQMVQMRTAQLNASNEELAKEVEERRAAEARLQISLDEKTTLLSEIHHRVRNNLQIISSLLSMTHRRAMNPEARQIIEESRSRIFAMAMIHSHLYRTGDFNRIDMEHYIATLWSSICQIHSPLNQQVTPVIRCDGVHLSIPQAIPCSLILNEAVTNVFKYAYEPGKGGPCHISMERCTKDRIRMRIRDEGRGISENIDVETTETLGLKLMRNLVRRQLAGEFHIERNGGGTDIWIEFRISPDDSPPHEEGTATPRPDGVSRPDHV